MAVVSMKQLLEAGVHFGHQTRRWNPKMKPYIFTERNGIYIIDLQKTVKMIDVAYDFVREAAAEGDILFVGTKKQAMESIRDEATRCGMHYVNVRWLGGTLTNFRTIRLRISRLEQLKKMREDGTFDLLTKKEAVKLELEIEKLEKFLGGIKNMTRLPKALFVVDPRKEHIAVAEARKLHIPIVAIVDTNCDPDEIDYIIPGNDDAIRAVKLLSSVMADAVLESRQGVQLEDGADEAPVANNKDGKEVRAAKPAEKKTEPAPEKKPEPAKEKAEVKKEEPKTEEKKPVAEKAEEKVEAVPVEEEKPVEKKAAAKKEEPAEEKAEEKKPAAKKTAEKKEADEEEKA